MSNTSIVCRFKWTKNCAIAFEFHGQIYFFVRYFSCYLFSMNEWSILCSNDVEFLTQLIELKYPIADLLPSELTKFHSNLPNFSMGIVLMKWIIKFIECGDWKDFMKVNIWLLWLSEILFLGSFFFNKNYVALTILGTFVPVLLFSSTLTPQSDKCIFNQRICLK